MNVEKFLSNVALFNGIELASLKTIIPYMKEESAASGAIIFKEDSPGDSLYVLLEGSVQVSRSLTLKVGRGSFEDKDKLFNKIDADGGHPFFGEVAIVDESPRTATVTALTDCRLLVLHREDFERLCSADTAVGYLLMRNICREICWLLRRHSRDVLKLTTALSFALNR